MPGPVAGLNCLPARFVAIRGQPVVREIERTKVQTFLMFLALIGGGLSSLLGPWILGLIAGVFLFDLWLGLRDRRLLVFAGLQAVGLIAGYAWMVSVGREMDVAGPWAWAMVVGGWALSCLGFHAWFLMARRRGWMA